MAEQFKCKGGGDDGCFTMLVLCFVFWVSGVFGVDEQVEKLQKDVDVMKQAIDRMEWDSSIEQLKQKGETNER